MKIDLKILSIPPFISTAWKNISSLHVEDIRENPILVVLLTNGHRIEVPSLDAQLIDEIFLIHRKVMELAQSGNENPAKSNVKPRNINFTADGIMPPQDGALPFRIGIEGIDGFGSTLQHNPEQSKAPDLPIEVLKKIAAISKAIGADTVNSMPKAEPHCNCLYCQVAKAITTGFAGEEIKPKTEMEEEVTPEDLKFREWDIEQIEENLYIVSNPFNKQELYTVFMGDPLACTCGEKNCAHIRAVLTT